MRTHESIPRKVVPVVLAGIGLLFVWQAVVVVWRLPPAILPTPWQCLIAATQQIRPLALATLSTGLASVVGLVSAAIIGAALAVVFTLSRTLRSALFPYVLAIQTVPIVAIAPLLIIWSGYTFRSVVIVTVIVCLFPITNSLVIGLIRVDRDHDDLFRLYKAGRTRRLLRLQIPSAVNDFVTGLKTSSALAVIGAVVAEFFVGNGTSLDGLGTLMTGWQMQLKTDALIAALFASAILGFSLYGMVEWVSQTALRRWMHR